MLIALAVGAGLYAFLPSEASGILRYIVVGVGALCVIPMVVTNPSRLTRPSRLGRGFAIAFTALLLIANQVALVLLLQQLLRGEGSGAATLLGAAQVWAINVIGYAVVYWEMDRGGPIARRRDAREELPAADFQFPQDSDRDAVSEVARRSSDVEDWAPGTWTILLLGIQRDGLQPDRCDAAHQPREALHDGAGHLGFRAAGAGDRAQRQHPELRWALPGSNRRHPRWNVRSTS